MKSNKSNIDILKDYVAGVRPFIQVGYNKQYVKRNIGEKWTDGKGIEWEQTKNGPQRVNRVANIVREAIGVEKCKCGQEIRWGSRTDKIFYSRTGMCSNCLIDYETTLRIAGIYDDYEAYKIISNEIGFLKDAKDKIKETIKFFSNESGDVNAVCNSEGFIERWKNTNREQILADAKRDLKTARQRIAVLSKRKIEFKKKFENGAKKWKIETYV